MQAVIICQPGGPEVLQIQEVEKPQALGDQVRVRVRAAGINRADLQQRMGNYPAPAGAPQDIPGLEFAGEIDTVGPLARQWKTGQRVMGITGGGAQAEYLVVHEGLLVEIPENLSFVQAAAVPEVFMTAHDALFTQGGIRMGERALIHAAGSGVGTAAIQLAHAAGATVFGTSRTPAKLERAKSLGLDFGLGDKTFSDDIRQLTNGTGVHLVLDFVGAPYMAQNLESLSNWGRIVIIALMGGSQANVNLAVVMQKRIQIRGCTLRTRTLEEKLTVTRLFASQVVPLLASGEVTPVVERVFPLREIAEAHTRLAENTSFGKLILSIG
jgi:putative PIG3 family NAD(P)H quinone oxidoreductase